MSGHSKWSTIKRQKGAADAKRSASFTKLGAAITIAAHEGGGDSVGNVRLRLAITKAREANMPKDNIERAIRRGTGELVGAAFEQLTYEAYGPGGVAFMISVVTDNKNRAISNIKSILSKYGAKLAAAGAVGYLFRPQGTMTVSGRPSEATEGAVVESGASDYVVTDDSIEVKTEPKDMLTVAKNLEVAGLVVADVETRLEPVSTVLMTDIKTMESLLKMAAELNELDDVASVSANFDRPAG